MTDKKGFESPLSRFIRLYCSQCSKWGKTCNMSLSGQTTMFLCIFAHGIVGDEPKEG